MCRLLFEKPIGCKYIRNYSVSQIFHRKTGAGNLLNFNITRFHFSGPLVADKKYTC